MQRWLMRRSLLFFPFLILLLSASACSLGYRQKAPEVLYSDTASVASSLQIPPDLTDISDGEQFVLPGTEGEALTRNTLLPEFDSARFVRRGGQSWLEIDASAESLWPELLGFMRAHGLTVLRTEPFYGVIISEWSLTRNVEESLLDNLLDRSSDSYRRVAFRMERVSGASKIIKTRLFSRVQQADKSVALAAGANQVAWPASSHDPEQTSMLLQQFLVHLGIKEQRAQGLLGASQGQHLLHAATMESTLAGPRLVLHSGYQQSFRRLRGVLPELGVLLLSQDERIGEIQVAQSTLADAPVLTLKLNPVHVSAVNVAVVDERGASITSPVVSNLLEQIRKALL